MLENPLVQLGIVFGSITAFIIIGCALQAAFEVLTKFVDFKLKGSYISAKAAIFMMVFIRNSRYVMI